MESVIRAAAVYALLLVLFRLASRRTLAETSTFDLMLLLLIISAATQNALVGQDYSLTSAFLVIGTLILLDVVLTFLLSRFRSLDKAVDGLPLVVVADGEPLWNRMRACRIDIADVLEAARRLRGLERLEQIQFAVLERSGGISIIPPRDGASIP
jgi:uncharacterized membrane protein YcaP (DUF421 family)